MGAYEEGLRGPITQKGAGGGHARVNGPWRGMFDGTTCNSVHPNFIKMRSIPLANGPEGTGKIYYQGNLMPKSSARNFNNPGDDQKIMSSTQIQAAQQAQQPAEVTHTKGQKVGDTESPTSVEAIGTQAAEPDGPPPDPFSNLDQLRLSQDHVAALGLKKQLMTVPARKPSKEWFVRVHPDPAYRLETAVIEFKEDSEVYLVDKSLWSELAAESTFSLRLFLTGISRPGNVVFLWPIRLPGEDGRLDTWNQSAMEIGTNIATKQWVRVSSNRHLAAYEPCIAAASDSWGEPKWPTEQFSDLLRLAFRKSYIDNPEHPVLKRLRGEE